MMPHMVLTRLSCGADNVRNIYYIGLMFDRRDKLDAFQRVISFFCPQWGGVAQAIILSIGLAVFQSSPS